MIDIGIPSLDRIIIEPSKSMMRSAWMGYDIDGRCVITGVLGIGTIKHHDAIIYKIVCGLDVWKLLNQ
jgi:hypothetical protein